MVKMYEYIGLMESTLYSCSILKKFEFSRQIFEKHSDMNFYENPSRGSLVVQCGQIDGQT
jgi:hypothetical protein